MPKRSCTTMPTGLADPASDDAVDQLAHLVMAWIGMSMRNRKGDQALKHMADSGMTMPQLVALHVLTFEGSMSVTLLTERLGLSSSATSHLVQRLVEAKFCERVEDSVDRRQRTVSLTSAGRDFVTAMMAARHVEMRAAVEPLSAALRVDLHGVLLRVVQEMAAQVQPPLPSGAGADKHLNDLRALTASPDPAPVTTPAPKPLAPKRTPSTRSPRPAPSPSSSASRPRKKKGQGRS